jgi:hypothetical protein
MSFRRRRFWVSCFSRETVWPSTGYVVHRRNLRHCWVYSSSSQSWLGYSKQRQESCLLLTEISSSVQPQQCTLHCWKCELYPIKLNPQVGYHSSTSPSTAWQSYLSVHWRNKVSMDARDVDRIWHGKTLCWFELNKKTEARRFTEQ